MNDDLVIARLRSALDEVAVTDARPAAADPRPTGHHDVVEAPVIDLHTAATGRRSARAWLGVAAATAVLVGAGGWALTQRSAPAATGESTTVVPTTMPSVTGVATLPWFELRLPDAVPGEVSETSTDSEANGFTQSWLVRGLGDDASSLGVLSIDVRYDAGGLPPDPAAYTELPAPQGTAWLNDDPTGTGSPALVWRRDDGTVWWVEQVGLLDPAEGGGPAFADYVFAIERGTFNDLLNNPDEQSEWIGAAPANERVSRNQDYTVGDAAAGVVLGVTSTQRLMALEGTTGITEIAVAGNRAWKGTRPTGEVTVVWLVDSEWWGLLRISSLLADRVDEIVAAVTPVAANVGEPAPVRTTVVPVTDPLTPPESTTGPTENSVRTDFPDLSIVSARIAPGPIEVAPAPPVDALGQVWRVQSDRLDGLLLVGVDDAVTDEEDLAEQGWRTITALEGVTEGTAWLAVGRGDDPASDQTAIVWARPEGVTWGFGWAGPSDSSTDEWIDLVLSATPGSGVPVVIADERATVLSVVAPPTTIVSRTFTGVDGGSAVLTLTDSATQLSGLILAESVTEIEVDGRTGWRVDDTSLGWVRVYWDAGDGWFAELTFDRGLAELADELITTNLVRLDG
ncbi:MAG: hypothetical protein ACK5CE_13730 [Actinomycetes bacterium]